jgi:Cu/Zn superoxide dismutase
MTERPSPVTLRFLDSESEGGVVTVEVKTAAGSLHVMAEVRLVGRTAYASGLHIHSNAAARTRSVGCS